jgi:hypothetical protein
VYGEMPEEGRHSRQCQPSGKNLCGSRGHAASRSAEGNCRAVKLTATGGSDVQCSRIGRSDAGGRLPAVRRTVGMMLPLAVPASHASAQAVSIAPVGVGHAIHRHQREGMARAKREGRYQGRVPTALRPTEGRWVKPSEIAVRLGASRANVHQC